MAKFEETLSKISNDIKELMKEENISDEKLSKLTGLNNDLKTLGDEHNKVAEKCIQYRDKYIDSITGYGTKADPKDDMGNKQGRTLEEIASDVLKQK